MTDRVATRIAETFNREFLASDHTLMVGGGSEPRYEPAFASQPARIVFTHDYPASALHEAAHWCFAGLIRRRQRDYGYWYVPGPRDSQQREAFFAAEAEVQAMEALFAQACGVRFVISADDFGASPPELDRFARIVSDRIETRRRGSLPPRARRFRRALTDVFVLHHV